MQYGNGRYCPLLVIVLAAKYLVTLATDMGRNAALVAACHAFEKAYVSEDAQAVRRASRDKHKSVWKSR